MEINQNSLTTINACIEWISTSLISLPHIDLKGLFRVPGNRDIINQIKKEFELFSIAGEKEDDSSNAAATSAITEGALSLAAASSSVPKDSRQLPSKLRVLSKVRALNTQTSDAEYTFCVANVISNFMNSFNTPLVPFSFISTERDIPDGYALAGQQSNLHDDNDVQHSSIESRRSASSIKLGESLILNLVSDHVTLGPETTMCIIQTVSALFSLFKTITEIPEMLMSTSNLLASVSSLFLSRDPAKLMLESANLKLIQNSFAKNDYASRNKIITFEALVLTGRRIHSMINDLSVIKDGYIESDLLIMIRSVTAKAKPIQRKRDKVRSMFLPFMNAEKEHQRQLEKLRRNISELENDDSQNPLTTIRGLKTKSLRLSKHDIDAIGINTSINSSFNGSLDALQEEGGINNANESQNYEKPPLTPSNSQKQSGNEGGIARQKSDRIRKVFRAIHSFNKESDGELTFSKGDTFYLKKNLGDGWVRVQRRGGQTTEIGIVPFSYLEEIPDDALDSVAQLELASLRNISTDMRRSASKLITSGSPKSLTKPRSSTDIANIAITGKDIFVRCNSGDYSGINNSSSRTQLSEASERLLVPAQSQELQNSIEASSAASSSTSQKKTKIGSMNSSKSDYAII